jgi:hypothetical protein
VALLVWRLLQDNLLADLGVGGGGGGDGGGGGGGVGGGR